MQFICRATNLYGRELEGMGHTPQEAWEDMLTGEEDGENVEYVRFFQQVDVIQKSETVSVIKNVWKVKG